jgi:2-dehydro-3-deoxygalactonokinase
MKPLIGVDWGTSSLRVARIDSAGHAIEERSSQRGILTVETGQFPSVLEAACGDWLAQDPLVLVCGMAGSRQGWVEAAYAPCPAGFDDIASHLAWVEPGRVAIVPGLSCERDGVPDVMRGEETQVFGALELLSTGSATLVLPGTHSKWVHARDGRIMDFSTFMTGEIYALLRHQSILARTMPPQDDDTLDEAALRTGIEQAMQSGSLLSAAFSARTLALFDRLPAKAAASYLSGLVIGEELRSQKLDRSQEVIVVAQAQLAKRYALALQGLGVASRCVGSEASWRGLSAIARRIGENA